jgi:YegS/Rv2252/BmrU family lipid kinase
MVLTPHPVLFRGFDIESLRTASLVQEQSAPVSVRRAALIYNPNSGQYSPRRLRAVEEVLAVLRAAGVEADAFETIEPGSGIDCAREAVQAGYDAVIACGGDGTVHEVMQSLVGTNVALGVIPLGTANALANDLGLLASPAKAAKKLLAATAVRIPAGRIRFRAPNGEEASRYFIVAAGVGADALLMARLDSRLKRRFGYALYIIEAIRIWATHNFPFFEVEPASGLCGCGSAFSVSQLLAVRVRSFGGILRRFVPGATLHSGSLHMIAIRTRSRLDYLRFLLAVAAGSHHFPAKIELIEAREIACRAHDGSQETLLVEADGEVLGSLPARIEVVADALYLLIPPGAQP